MLNSNKNSDSIANSLDNSAREKAQNISSSLETLAHNFGSDLGKKANIVTERTSGLINSTRSYVEENPIQSVAIAATLGLVLGSLFTKSRKS